MGDNMSFTGSMTLDNFENSKVCSPNAIVFSYG